MFTLQNLYPDHGELQQHQVSMNWWAISKICEWLEFEDACLTWAD